MVRDELDDKEVSVTSLYHKKMARLVADELWL